MIGVTAVADTEIIKITVTDTNKNNAKVIADEAANVFVEEIPELYNISNVSILDTAEVAEHPYNVNLKKQLALYIMVGLVLGFGTLIDLLNLENKLKQN